LRLAVVSPFLDRQHGTELCVIEQVERLAALPGWEIHLYAQRVEDVKGVQPVTGTSSCPTGSILWHKVGQLPGPHLLNYLWWFAANQIQRWRDSRKPALRPDVTYSPGINCLNADAIVVHIVFREFYDLVRDDLRLRRLPVLSWPRTLHRKLYYRLIVSLERRIYGDPRVKLAAVSSLVAGQLKKHFGRADVLVIPNAVDSVRFSPQARSKRRTDARATLGYSPDEFVLLLIGNDWKKKGLDTLLASLALLRDLPCKLLVVGRDAAAPYRAIINDAKLGESVQFHEPASDVVQFYAAADAYVGPSLEDAFNLPILEAMASGLPVIASVRAGASENICHSENGFLLQDPRNAQELAGLVRRLFADSSLRQKMGDAAARTAGECNWQNNAMRTKAFLEGAAEIRARSAELRP
jgi:glycosyltransferase involved in cell wall biosynthesis